MLSLAPKIFSWPSLLQPLHKALESQLTQLASDLGKYGGFWIGRLIHRIEASQKSQFSKGSKTNGLGPILSISMVAIIIAVKSTVPFGSFALISFH